MSAMELRKQIKKAVDRVPIKQLESLADYVAFLSRSSFEERIKKAEEDIAKGKVVNWRHVRSDV